MSQKLTIIFDLDGTLADTAPDLLSAHNHVMKKFGFDTKNIDEIREYVGHGIGRKLHEDPQIPNYGLMNTGPVLKEGMCLAIEPMINEGTEDIITKKEGWTICTADGKPSAHFEHTVTVTKKGVEILTI